jgi:hypothetical protein
MKCFPVLFFGVVSCHAEFAFANEQISLTRNIIVESCSVDLSDCKQMSTGIPVQVDIPLSQVGKSAAVKDEGRGTHGEIRFRTLHAGTPFKGELFVNKILSGYSIYAVLRSGKGTRRNGVTKTIKIEDPSTFAAIELVDKPIIVGNKTYRARMVISSATSPLPLNAFSVAPEKLPQIRQHDGSFPEQYWGPAIKALAPIRVLDHHNNIAVVTSEDSSTTAGVYFSGVYSSYRPTNSATETFSWDTEAKVLRFTFRR